VDIDLHSPFLYIAATLLELDESMACWECEENKYIKKYDEQVPWTISTRELRSREDAS
jgi:hypothetical protein